MLSLMERIIEPGKYLMIDNTDKKHICVNLGCGKHIIKNYINCDIKKYKSKVQMILDLEQPLPFKNESVDFVLLNGVMAHIKHPLKLRKEIDRILKPLGTLSIGVCSCPCSHNNNVGGHYIKV